MSDYWKGKHCLHDAQRPDCQQPGWMRSDNTESTNRCCKCGLWEQEIQASHELRALCPEKEG